MAINTENKRRSAIGMGMITHTIFPIGDGTIDGPDRPHSIGLFAGTGYPGFFEDTGDMVIGPYGSIFIGDGVVMGPIDSIFKE